MRTELADTLTELIESVHAPASTGIVVTRAEIDLPLEVTAATRGASLVFFGSAPHSRWRSGVLPDVHMAHVRVEAVEEM